MNENRGTSEVPNTTLFCLGCNERFRLARDDSVCPRCGAEVHDDRALDETLLIRDQRDQHQSVVSDAANRPDQLVGTDLHVYRCESLLGSGGMARVYLAFHSDLHRRCALKILSPRRVQTDADYVTRFAQEGRAAAALVHPNIVTTHAVGQAREHHFLEMEFVAGRSLQQLIEDEGRLTPVRAMALITQTAAGLAVAHRKGIVHRDLKPDNILLTEHGIPKISDFGLAKRIAGADDALTAEGICGTPHFMAPELFNGEPAAPSSDIYALGVCLFLLLTGRLPFVAGSLNELQRMVTTEPAPNVRDEFPKVSLEMAECLNLLMARSPANRPQNATEASQLLNAVLGQVRDIESLLVEAFRDDHDVTWTRRDRQYRLELTLPDGRRQKLFIEPSEHSPTERLLLIYSVCCESQPDYYEQALRLNSEISHGGLAIREIDGESKFVVTDTYPRATVDTEEVRRSVLEVALRADEVEKLLTGMDLH